MKQLLTILMLFITATALALVGSGKAQIITVTRNAKQTIVFMVHDSKNFVDVDSCAKYCWNRSSSIATNSIWSNMVNIFIQTDLSKEDRQYIGDRFVANYVYPHNIVWIENGNTNRVEYLPDKKSCRSKRILK